MLATDPVVTFLLVLVIGIIAGVLFDRLAGPSWFARQSDLKRLVKQLKVFVHAISKLPPRAKGELNKIVAAQDWRSFDTEKLGELFHEMIRVLAKSSPACIANTALSAVIEPLRASRHPAVAQIARTAPPAMLDL